jgi:hypothetical protein
MCNARRTPYGRTFMASIRCFLGFARSVPAPAAPLKQNIGATCSIVQPWHAFTVKGRVVQFEEHVLKRHRGLKMRLSHYILSACPLLVLAAPLIYSLIIPFVLLDSFISAYQFICFPLFGIPAVRRSDYLVIDRVHLSYLNAIEKINCAYCAYANGLIAYAREITSLTEQY